MSFLSDWFQKPTLRQVPTLGTRVLCICEGGNVRSVGLAFRLKQCHGLDAIAASWRFNSPETLKLLYGWADRIVVMQPEMWEHVPAEFRSKAAICDVGPDNYGTAFHPVLQDRLERLLKGEAA